MVNNDMSNILRDNKIQETSISKDQQLQIVESQIDQLAATTFDQLIRTQRRGIDYMWNHPTLTPQEIIDHLGDKTQDIFQFHSALTSFIKSVADMANIEVDLKYPTNLVELDPETNKFVVTSDPYPVPQ